MEIKMVFNALGHMDSLRKGKCTQKDHFNEKSSELRTND